MPDGSSHGAQYGRMFKMWLKEKRTLRKLAAECFGTFALVFAGTGAIIINDVSGGAITHAGIALTFGLIVLAMIFTVGEVSGAHLNPAVTVGLAVAGRFERRLVVPYCLSQVMGAFSASLVLKVLFPQHATLGATLPAGAVLQSFVLEAILTLILMVVILSLFSCSGEKRVIAAIAIGAVIALEAMFAGPICGASMNPARSLAPAVVSGQLQSLWVYLVAPVLGAVLAIPLGAVLFGGEE